MNKQLTSGVLKGFVQSLLAPTYDQPVPVPDCHLEWWNLCLSKDRFVSIAAPRKHGKTTCITQAYLEAELLFRKSSFGVICSDTDSQACEFYNAVRKDLTTNDDLISLFEIGDILKETESDIIVEFKDGKQFRITTLGAGNTVRGLKWINQRPDIIIMDDVENDQSVMTKEQRIKMKRWVLSALMPALANNGKIRAVGTILHFDSWLSGTMPEEKSQVTVNEPLKVWSRVKRAGWKGTLYRAHPAIEVYEPRLWPTYHPVEYFKEMYAACVENGEPDLYSQEQLNYPMDETRAYFKRTDFIPMREEDKGKRLEYYAAADFAISTSARADYTAIVIVGVDETGLMYLVDVVRERLDPVEASDELFRLEEKYHPAFFVVERGAMEKSVGATLNREMHQRRVYLNFMPMTTSGDKQYKARGIQKIMRSGGMKFDTKADWYPALEDEFLRFTRRGHDDQVDALALIGLKSDMIMDAQPQSEVDEEEYQEEHEYQPIGISRITGY